MLIRGRKNWQAGGELMHRSLAKLIAWSLALLLTAAWPGSKVAVRAFGARQPCWTIRNDRALVLAERGRSWAILLYADELEYTYSGWITRGPGRRPLGAVRSRFIQLWPITLIGFVLCAYIGVLPLVRSRRRTARRLCLNCGYSLHGLTESRCPECGTPFEMSKLKETESSQQDPTP